jgi:hypothetical protein
MTDGTVGVLESTDAAAKKIDNEQLLNGGGVTVQRQRIAIPDGADVAQGATSDASGASTVVGKLKQIAAAVTATLTADVTDRAARLLGHVTVDNASIPVTDNAGSLTVDAPVGTPLWVRLSDGSAAFIGQKTMANSVPVAIASDQSAIPVDSELTTLDYDSGAGTSNAAVSGVVVAAAGGPAAITGDVANGLDVDVTRLPALPAGANTIGKVDQGAAGAARWLVDASGVAVPITDNSGSLTVDAPVGTPVFARLSDGAAALIGQKAMAASLPVVVASDQGNVPVDNTELPAAAALADATANPTTTLLESLNGLFNGTSWDRARGNYDTTTGDSGTKTVTFAGATQTNYNALGAFILVKCGTVSGTSPTLSCQLQWSYDGGTNWLNVGAALANLTATNNTGAIVVYPSNVSQAAGATPANLTTGATATAALNLSLPRTWRINYTIGGTTPSFAITAVYVNYIV